MRNRTQILAITDEAKFIDRSCAPLRTVIARKALPLEAYAGAGVALGMVVWFALTCMHIL